MFHKNKWKVSKIYSNTACAFSTFRFVKKALSGLDQELSQGPTCTEEAGEHGV